MTDVSKRDALQALMSELRTDEENAMAEAGAYFKSPEAVGFRARIDGFHKRTVPSSPFDQLFGSVLKVFDSMDSMVSKLVEARVAANSTAAKVAAPAEETVSEVKEELEASK